MMSKDGEWILVDMYMMTNIAVRMVSSVLNDNDNVESDSDLAYAFNCLRAIQNLYSSLQVYCNFYSQVYLSYSIALIN